MKYLDYPELELLSGALTFDSSECKVFTRLEAYSCKAVNREKRLFKSFDNMYKESLKLSVSMSPPDHHDGVLASPFGPLDQHSSRKTLFLLIATLNAAFPDHDFSSVNPSDFRKEESPAMVLSSLSTTLFSLRGDSGALRSFSSLPGSYDDARAAMSPPNALGAGYNGSGAFGSGSAGAGFSTSPNSGATTSHPALSSILDDIMCVADCEVFTFHPDYDSDPHATADLDEEAVLGPHGDHFTEVGSDDDERMHDDYQDDGVGTPRADSSYGKEDTFMLDEDFTGGFGRNKEDDSTGAGPSTSAASASSVDEPTTPRTPTSSQHYFDKQRGESSLPSSSPSHSYPMPLYAAPDSPAYDDEDDLDSGLLWATYAFFYNRKLKRILFVSVWSRKTGTGRPDISPPPVHAMPHRPYATRPTQIASSAPNPRSAVPSPAKRAIARTNSGRTGPSPTGRRTSRARSGSPAPSSLSPFPHASPHARITKTPSSNLAPSHLTTSSLDGALMSVSAPAGGAVPNKQSTKRATDLAPHVDQSDPTSKRARMDEDA